MQAKSRTEDVDTWTRCCGEEVKQGLQTRLGSRHGFPRSLLDLVEAIDVPWHIPEEVVPLVGEGDGGLRTH